MQIEWLIEINEKDMITVYRIPGKRVSDFNEIKDKNRSESQCYSKEMI